MGESVPVDQMTLAAQDVKAYLAEARCRSLRGVTSWTLLVTSTPGSKIRLIFVSWRNCSSA